VIGGSEARNPRSPWWKARCCTALRSRIASCLDMYAFSTLLLFRSRLGFSGLGNVEIRGLWRRMWCGCVRRELHWSVEAGLVFPRSLLLTVQMAEIYCDVTAWAVREGSCSHRWALPFSHRSSWQEYFLRELLRGRLLHSCLALVEI
jgi:hypothetical protein